MKIIKPMKNIRSICSLSLFAISFFFVSCDNEVVDPILKAQAAAAAANENNNSASTAIVAGTYLLTAFNTSVPTDLNGDGTSSTNQMTETSCFNNSLLTLNANNTFTANSKGIDIDLNANPNVITCFSDPDTTGTWSINGNVVVTTYVEAGVTYNDYFTVVGNTLILSENNGEIVGTAGGNPVFLTSNIAIVYSKQ